MSEAQPIPHRARRRDRLLLVAAVFAGYAILAVVTSWPVAARIATDMSGTPPADSPLHYWNGWEVQQALAGGRSPLYTTLLFYPHGVSLVTQNIAWFNVLPWLVLQPLVGGIAAFNLALLLNLALCGCTLFWLARRLTGDARAAFVAGVIYLAWPYRLSQLDHPNMLATEWLPVFFLFLILTIKEGRWRAAALAGLCFALVGYTRWQQLIPAALMALVYFATALPGLLTPARRYVFSRLVLAGGVAALLLAPPAALLASEQSGDDPADVMREGDEVKMATDLLAFVTPAAGHSILGQWTDPLIAHIYAQREPARRAPAYLGVTAVLLAVIGVAARRREGLPWVLMALFLIALALGPVLRVNGQVYRIPTLYGALEPLQVFRLMREPDRYNVFLALPVAVLAAYGLAALFASRRWPAAWTKTLASGALTGLVLCEYLAVPVPMQNLAPLSPFLTQLAREPGEFAVVQVPFDTQAAKTYMFEQTVHGRPMLEGNLSRLPAGAYQYIDSIPLLRILRKRGEMAPRLAGVTRELATLARDHVRYLIVRKTAAAINQDQLARWERYLLMSPAYEDDTLAAFRTVPEAGRDFTLRQELAPGLGPIQVSASSACLNPGHPLVVDAGWGSRLAQTRDLTATVALVDAQGLARQTERFPVSAGWPTSQWPANSIAWGYYPLTVAPQLPAGTYTVTLALTDGAGQPPGASLAVEQATLQPQTCDAGQGPETVDANVSFGNEIHLEQYALSRQPGQVQLTLSWRGLQPMSTNYTVFVHLFDPATGEDVAQADAMPFQGAWPTSLWWPGDLQPDDRVTISLDGVAPGRYSIAVGIYDSETMQRLPATDGRGRLLPDGRFSLAQIVEVK